MTHGQCGSRGSELIEHYNPKCIEHGGCSLLKSLLTSTQMHSVREKLVILWLKNDSFSLILLSHILRFFLGVMQHVQSWRIVIEEVYKGSTQSHSSAPSKYANMMATSKKQLPEVSVPTEAGMITRSRILSESQDLYEHE